ncbi:unnamed protein product [Penicillium olsonii]|uniref:Uncharacterized protein n=1 Tax=Penicillium olsonii TaxID=99116 RepID=A0A9W4HTQ0_PENOL|nr:unnamed protein product [Penicillium olsonii]CAG8157194.1 unnamed protein product [Penicillium olsonii]
MPSHGTHGGGRVLVAFGATSYVPVPVPGPGPGPIQHIGRQRRTTRRRSRQFRRWVQAAATEPVLLAPVNRTPAEYQAGASAHQGPIEPLESDTVDLAEDQLSSGSGKLLDTFHSYLASCQPPSPSIPIVFVWT